MITKLQLEKALSLVMDVSVPPCDAQNQADAVNMIARMIATQEEIAEQKLKDIYSFIDGSEHPLEDFVKRKSEEKIKAKTQREQDKA